MSESYTKGWGLLKKILSGKIEGGEGGIGSPLSPPRNPRHATDLVPYDVTSFRFSWNDSEDSENIPMKQYWFELSCRLGW